MHRQPTSPASAWSCSRADPRASVRVLFVALVALTCSIAPASMGRAEEKALRKVGLAEALEAALDRNPDVVLARHELERADALVRSARGAAIPTLTGNGT